MSLIYYQPSGKYNNKAPTIIFFTVFILSSISGMICGWLLSEKGFFLYVDFTCSLVIILFLLYINSKIISKLFKQLQIRSPKIAFRLGIISSSLGWIFFNCLIRYYTLSETKQGVISFFIERMTNGYPMGITIAFFSFSDTIFFYAPWFIASPIWIIELLIMPFIFSRILIMYASLPFSEQTNSWHIKVELPYTIFMPKKKQVKEELSHGNLDVFLNLYPEKYFEDNILNWGKINLFIPFYGQDICYIDISNIFERLFYINKNNVLLFYYIINKDTAEVLLSRFGYFNTKKKKCTLGSLFFF
jgi:hypothetical protein